MNYCTTVVIHDLLFDATDKRFNDLVVNDLILQNTVILTVVLGAQIVWTLINTKLDNLS